MDTMMLQQASWFGGDMNCMSVELLISPEPTAEQLEFGVNCMSWGLPDGIGVIPF